MSRVFTRIDWNHPIHGRIEEVACDNHRREVLGALRTLGIGAGGTPTEDTACLRCRHVGEHPRTFLPPTTTEVSQ